MPTVRVARRPLRMPAEMQIQPAWQMKASGLRAASKARVRFENLGVAAQPVGGEAARQQQGVEVRRGDFGDGGVGRAGIAVLAGVGPSSLGAGDGDPPAFFLQPKFGIPQFQVFVDVIDQGQDAFHERILV